jgi:heme-degrading monooxygenase HmoA
MDGSVLRIFRARPRELAFDAIVREELIPDLRRLPGMLEAWVGRSGPDELGERAIVTRWVDRDAMFRAMGDDVERSRFHPEHLSQTTDRRLEVLRIRLLVRGPATMGEPAVLRVARGRLRAVDLDTYVGDVAAGARRDIDRGRGPSTLILCETASDAFVTLSTWRDWESIAAATGASLDRPVRTREQHELLAFGADHYELVIVPATG